MLQRDWSKPRQSLLTMVTPHALLTNALVFSQGDAVAAPLVTAFAAAAAELRRVEGEETLLRVPFTSLFEYLRVRLSFYLSLAEGIVWWCCVVDVYVLLCVLW